MIERGERESGGAAAQDREAGVVLRAGQIEAFALRGSEQRGRDDADGRRRSDEGDTADRWLEVERACGVADAPEELGPGFAIGLETAGDPGFDEFRVAGLPFSMDRVGGVFGLLNDASVGKAELFVNRGQLRADRGIDGVEVELIPGRVDNRTAAQGRNGLLLAAERA